MPAIAFLGERPTGGLAGLACTPHATESAQLCSVVDGSPLGALPVGTAGDLAEAVRRAGSAQRAWAAMPVAFRLAPFKRLVGLLDSYRHPMAEVLRAETGIDPATAEDQVARSGPESLRVARAGMRVLRPVRHRTGLRTTAVERHEPRGVVGIVPDPAAPFDPVTATAALVAGNGVVLLPELRCGFTALFLTRLLAASRLPADLVQVVPGRAGLAAAAAAAVDHMVADPVTADGLQDACAGHGTALASGPRTDPLDFTTSRVARR